MMEWSSPINFAFPLMASHTAITPTFASLAPTRSLSSSPQPGEESPFMDEFDERQSYGEEGNADGYGSTAEDMR